MTIKVGFASKAPEENREGVVLAEIGNLGVVFTDNLKKLVRDSLQGGKEATYHLKGSDNVKRILAEILTNKFEVDPTRTLQLVDPDKRMYLSREWPNNDEVAKDMVNEIEPWQKLLDFKSSEYILQTASGIASRIYMLPYESRDFIRRDGENGSSHKRSPPTFRHKSHR